MVSRVHGFRLAVQGAWCRDHEVPGFMSTGYIISRGGINEYEEVKTLTLVPGQLSQMKV